MNILVTGATGFIGSHLVEALLKRKYHVACLVRKTSNLRWLTGLDVELVYGELSNPADIEKAIAGRDYFYHLAGVTKAFTKEEYFKGNYQSTKTLMETCANSRHSLKKILHVSSLAAAGPSLDGTPLREDCACKPVTWYGESKLQAEAAILPFMDKLPITIVRPPIVYGPRDTDVFDYFKTIKCGIRLLTGRGKKYSIVYVEDLVEGILSACETPVSAGRIYYIADPRIYEWENIADAIKKTIGRRTITLNMPHCVIGLAARVNENICKCFNKKTIFNRQKAMEILQPNWVCDTAKATAELHFAPKYTLEQGIQKTYEWYKENKWL
ncbi:MAG: NAD(P)-dependent oxidoreductase [Planctomycetes bacterium]|nr:NAD(P)-dependent oxidoreductase [Planctomycetota bacterium]